MFQVRCLKSTRSDNTEFYGKYSIGPFLRGQSNTIGNALRRVLLSNLQGLAITGVRITGINHEFSTIPGIKEDVVDILLNLKQIVLKGNITEPTVARLKVNQPGIIIAKDIELPSNVMLVDPNQYVASLTSMANIEMEFLITKGQNYFTSNQMDPTLPDSFLGVDAVFMPVIKVNFFIETSISDTPSDLESLILEIWTNGSIMPDQALTSSAEILENTFRKISILPTSFEAPIKEKKIEHFQTISIEKLKLSVRVYNSLTNANIETLFDLMQYSAHDLLQFKNFGKKSAEEVRKKLKTRFNLKLQDY